MANVKITELTAATALAGTDVLPIVDVGADATKKVSVSDLLRNLPDGTASAPALAFADDQNTGVLSPGNNSLAFATSGTQRLVIDSSGKVGVGTSSPRTNLQIGSFGGNDSNIQLAASTTGASNILFGDASDGANWYKGFIKYAHSSDLLEFYSSGALKASTGGSERLRIDSSGRVGIGNSTMSSFTGNASDNLVVGSGSGGEGITVYSATNNQGSITFADGISGDAAYRGAVEYNHTNDRLAFRTAGTGNRMVIDSSGNVGIGESTPAAGLDLKVDTNPVLAIDRGSANTANFNLQYNGTLTGQLSAANADFQISGVGSSTPISFYVNGSERMRIDSSGRLLVGTSSQSNSALLTVEGNTGNNSGAGELTLQRGEAATSITANESIGHIYFQDNSNKKFAEIACFADAAAGSNDYPGRILFSTTADGASSPTERMRITSGGFVNIGNGGTDIIWNQTSATGVGLGTVGVIQAARDGDQLMLLNRLTNDGTIVSFAQNGTLEGVITVSGGTVSYNGGHLARWSQLAGGAERTEILRGSVLSNLDEMCEWGEEDNEQLNRMKVSDAEGDVNVSGVFQAWDDDDDTYTNDFYCAMTGDFVIRIAQGTTVARGDLLMSAGDGTAKPQDDDIVRSKTIAKVTSTTVSTTYSDGSYCVPCVLMAC